MQYTVGELSKILKGKIEGDPDLIVRQPAKIEEAQEGSITFVSNPQYFQYVNETKASVIIVDEGAEFTEAITPTLIRVPNAYQAFTKVLELFTMGQSDKKGIEQPSFIGGNVKYGSDVYIGAFSYIGENVAIGDNVKIYPNTFVGDNAVIGDNTIIHAGVKIYHACKIGNNCILHSGVVIGSDGFGFAPSETGEFTKIPQTGNVVVKDNVEIGANTVIDRATMGSTIIEKGVKLDNLIQIAHNVEIGENTAIAAQTGISGSTRVGKNCMIAGQVGMIGHITIADQTKIGAQSGIGKSINEVDTAWSGSPAIEHKSNLKAQAVYKMLPELHAKIKELEKKVSELTDN